MNTTAYARPQPRSGGRELSRVSEALAELGRALAPVSNETFLPFEEVLADWRTPRTSGDLGPRFPVLLREAHARVEGAVTHTVFNRALVAHLASTLRFRLGELALPADVLNRLPSALNRLHAFLSSARETYTLGDEYFLRDVRLAAGWSAPCGSEVIDLRTRVSLPAGLLIAIRARAPRLMVRTLKPGGVPWFSPHTDPRYLVEFDEAGWERTYRNVAALLRRHPGIAGVAGYSWFYDPRLEEISPRLAYLRRRPLDGGAFVLRGHTTDFDITNATVKSPTRRRLYEAGEYVPIGYRMVWLRGDILSWAERTPSLAL